LDADARKEEDEWWWEKKGIGSRFFAQMEMKRILFWRRETKK